METSFRGFSYNANFSPFGGQKEGHVRSVKRKMAALLAAVLMASGITAGMPVAAAGNVADAGTDVSAGKSAAVQAELAAGADAVAQTDADTGADIHGEAKIPAGTDETAGETQIPTVSGQLGKKPEGTDAAGTPDTEAWSVEEIVEMLYAEVPEDDLAELVSRAEDAFTETEAPEGATDAEEYERMLSLVRKEAEAYLEEVLEKAKAEYAQLGQAEVYEAVLNGLCGKIMAAIKELYGMEEPAVMSLLPLTEKQIYPDLMGLTPLELTRTPFSKIFEGEDLEGVNKIAYVYHYSDDEDSEDYSDGYVVADYPGYANLCYGTDSTTSYYASGHYVGNQYVPGYNVDDCSKRPWLMIPDGDQLEGETTRYIVRPQVTASEEWLTPTVYWQDDAGGRAELEVSGYRYRDMADSSYYYGQDERFMTINVEDSKIPVGWPAVYVKFEINKEIYENLQNIAEIKVYEGSYATAEAAMAGTEITEQVYGDVDMGQPDAGYVVEFSGSSSTNSSDKKEITMVAFDGNGNVTGCLSFSFRVNRSGVSRNYGTVVPDDFFERIITEEDKDAGISASVSRKTVDDRLIRQKGQDGSETLIYELYKEYAADGKYCITMNYWPRGSSGLYSSNSSNGFVTAAYTGVYESIAAAEKAGAEDIKKSLFGLWPDRWPDSKKIGYEADYSAGVSFTIFVGRDGEGQEVHHCTVKARNGNSSAFDPSLSGGTDVDFSGLMDKDGRRVSCYAVKHKDDSYAEGNYPTIVVKEDVDLKELAPIFTTASGVNLYAAGSSEPEKSGENYHDFSGGPVHYTTASENGKNQKNVWLTVKREESSENTEEKKYNLYTNNLSDSEAGTREENGVTYSKREVVLGDVGDSHDIFLINMGNNVIPKLSVELESGLLEIDEYWTLNGNHDLSEFSGIADTTHYGELANMAKVRLKRKAGTEDGAEVSGTLRIKADGELIMALELTGIVGIPVIVTDTIPEAVKYIPYGTMIQNSNKYSKTRIGYSVSGGLLPEGMELRENGELYGVPLEAGTFEFTVRMRSANPGGQSEQKLTLVVKENTDENVNAATDAGYDVLQRIPTVAIGSTDSHDFVSQGILNEFVDVFLDGQKLEKDVDYTAESGSTRLTISSQTLTRSNQTGAHTLGLEFRTGDDNVLKAAGQNFNVVGAAGSSGSGNNSSGNGGSGSGDSGDSGNSGGGSSSGSSTEGNSSGSASANSSQFTANTIAAQGTAGAEAVRTVIYTVAPGDTLSGIAVRYYGNASLWKRIYEDNRDVITNPNRVRAGMQIKLYLANVTAQTDETGNTTADTAGQYTIRSGDSLWRIARTMYGQGGQWRRIYEANRSVIPDSLILRVGQVITIP